MKNKIYLIKMLLRVFSYFPSGFKLFIYKRLGADIGKQVSLGIGSYIIPFDNDFKKIHIADNVKIEDHVKIYAKHLYLGNDVAIKENTTIWGRSDFRMGSYGYMDQHCLIDLRYDITLGNFSGIGADSWLYTHGVFHSVLSGAPVKFGPIIIHDRVWIAANVFIMPDITIGEDAIVGACSVVTKNVKPDSVVAGNPAREIGKTSESTRKLTREDKIQIVRKIISDFVKVFDSKISRFNDAGSYTTFKFRSVMFIFIPAEISLPLIDEITGTFGRNIVLISFDIPGPVREYCKTSQISWFDLEHSLTAGDSNDEFHEFERFLGGYGIILNS